MDRTRRMARLLGRRGRLQSRASQRGAAIFVVILVLTILTAIGMFATRAAGLNQRLSGYSRQASQTGYVAEYGSLMVFDEITGPSGQAYIDQMKTASDVCQASSRIDAGPGEVACYKIGMGEMQNKLTSEGNGAQLIDTTGGSLGDFEAPTTADFNVEMTDLYKGAPAAGSDQTGLVPGFGYMQITLTSSGQVRPIAPAADPDAGVCTTPAEQESAQLSGTRSVRMIIETRVAK